MSADLKPTLLMQAYQHVFQPNQGQQQGQQAAWQQPQVQSTPCFWKYNLSNTLVGAVAWHNILSAHCNQSHANRGKGTKQIASIEELLLQSYQLREISRVLLGSVPAYAVLYARYSQV